MCKALDDMYESAKREGKREGELKGRREERINMVFLMLEKYGKISKQLKSRIRQEQDLEVLSQWIRQAMTVKSLGEFEEKISA